ncbi:hypothetical protein V1511DRAFT_47812 [Dipodascopsis uninucleata]
MPPNGFDSKLLDSKSFVEAGSLWRPVLEQADCSFETDHFHKAMMNLILHPNINSTSIMRADIMEDSLKPQSSDNDYKKTEHERSLSLDDRHKYNTKSRTISLELKSLRLVETQPQQEIIRKIIPRNPNKDLPLFQTCQIYSFRTKETFVVYIPHVDKAEDMPYYHPAVSAVGLRYSEVERTIQVFYRIFESDAQNEISHRLQRTALKLLGTAFKHSCGVQQGYQKRVHHDLVVDRVKFQTRYVELKNRLARFLVDNWAESTDPKKHVFEDLAIATFLIELWTNRSSDGDSRYSKENLRFLDVGCGNGVLVYILIQEGYIGTGIDARRRKTWAIFPEHVQNCLKERLIVPYLCNPSISENSGSLEIHDGRFDEDSNWFLIGNHSDELTPWIPLLGQPFMVIPCCSHALSGAKFRYSTIPLPTSQADSQQTKLSTYGALVQHVVKLAGDAGWDVKREMLRIPSTRNAAIIGLDRTKNDRSMSPEDIVAREGGADGFWDNVMKLSKKGPRNH